jgi:myosin-light-chain kinase
VIAYVLLSGLSPFLGDSDVETLANVTRAEPITFDEDPASESNIISS